MKKIILLIISLSAVLTSCAEDDSPASTNIDSSSILPKKIGFTSNGSNPILWNLDYNDKQIQLLHSQDNNSRQEYIYTNNLVTNIKTYQDNRLAYELRIKYNANNKISTYSVYNNTGREAWRHDLTYPSSNVIVEEIYDGNILEATETHTLQNGNISRDEITNVNGYTYSVNYEYDNKNAPKKNVALREIFQLIQYDNDGEYNLNNCIKKTAIHEGSVWEDKSYTYSHTYDSNNFPLTKTRSAINGNLISSNTYSY